MVVQWLGRQASIAGGPGSIPGRGTKIPQAARCSRKKARQCPVQIRLREVCNLTYCWLENKLVKFLCWQLGSSFQKSLKSKLIDQAILLLAKPFLERLSHVEILFQGY